MQVLSGWIQCSMRTTFTDVRTYSSGSARTMYSDQQQLRWSWTNTPPLLVSTGNQSFTVSFTAQGGGTKTLHEESTSPNGAMHTQDGIDTWMVNCQAMLPLQIRQTSNGIVLSSQETYPASGITLTQKLLLDNVLQGQPTTTMVAALALAVSINFGPSLTDVLHRSGPLSVATFNPSTALSGSHTSRPGAPIIRGASSAYLSPPRGPDAPLPNYPTSVNWIWEITTQP